MSTNLDTGIEEREQWRERILRALPLKRYTDRTVTSLPALRAALEEVRQTGVCVNLDELAVGAAGIAAPIFDRDGRVAGACAIGGPTDRVRPRLKLLAAEVRATARAISAAIWPWLARNELASAAVTLIITVIGRCSGAAASFRITRSGGTTSSPRRAMIGTSSGRSPEPAKLPPW